MPICQDIGTQNKKHFKCFETEEFKCNCGEWIVKETKDSLNKVFYVIENII